jgi:Flp pilus assembly CpaE family ATPase
MPYIFDDLYIRLLAAADQVVMAGAQTLPSLHDLKVMCDALRQQHHIRMPHVVINRYHADRADFAAADIAGILGPGRLFTVAEDVAGMAAALEKGQPLRQAAPHSPAVKDLHALAQALFPQEHEDEQTGQGGLLNWLSRFFPTSRSRPDRRSSP